MTTFRHAGLCAFDWHTADETDLSVFFLVGSAVRTLSRFMAYAYAKIAQNFVRQYLLMSVGRRLGGGHEHAGVHAKRRGGTQRYFLFGGIRGVSVLSPYSYFAWR